MASTSTTQRLLRELKDYAKSPNEALLHLGPVDEDDLLHWEAVLKGVKGTPYEGELSNPGTGRIRRPTLSHPSTPQRHTSLRHNPTILSASAC